MPTSDKKKQYNMQYNKLHTRQINMRFTSNDADILDKLDTISNKQGYIKDLIRADIARNPVSKKENVPAETRCPMEREEIDCNQNNDMEPNKIKEPYEELEIEVIDFQYEDVISCD